MSTEAIGAFEAKTHFGQLLDRVERGEEIEITRRGRPVARLVPFERGPNVTDLQRLIAKVREERGSYKISAKDIRAWRQEGRR
ncbi:MAG: type II toxin-antitoxin system prevent-host-death family antitoxin [Kiritimatiellae bacterium]|nr:type II toxin-antitoxin system prevent-host-death family antitoxin [Kiritimatiellia bacterium]